MRIAAALALAAACQAQDRQAFAKKVTEFSLANGAHFIVVERHDAPAVSLHTYVGAGLADDPPGKTGLAQMFERLAYSGVPEIAGSAGRRASAGVDSTSFFENLPPREIETWLKLEARRLMHPVYTEFEQVRALLRAAPPDALLDALFSTALGDHPYGSVARPLGEFGIADAGRFHQTHYVAANVTIAIAGDVNPAEVKKYAGRHFGEMSAATPKVPARAAQFQIPGPRRVSIEGSGPPLLYAGYARPGQNDADDPVFDLLALWLSARPSIPGGRWPNLFVFSVAGKPAGEAESAVEALVTRARNELIDPETLARLKRRTRLEVLSQLDGNAGLARAVAFYHANYGAWNKVFGVLDGIERVTAEDMRRVARRYFTAEGRTVAVRGIK